MKDIFFAGVVEKYFKGGTNKNDKEKICIDYTDIYDYHVANFDKLFLRGRGNR